MSKELDFARELINFIYESPTAFHAVDSTRKMLEGSGFSQLREEDRWKLKKGGKYYVNKNSSALIAFIVGMGAVQEEGFRVIAAHTDFPTFRIKPAPEMTAENHYIKLDTETYGGPILNTWLDRPLSVAGRVALKGGDIYNPVTKLVNIRKPILIIPNLALHLNKGINSGLELNKQKDMLPLMAMVNEKLEKDNYLLNAIAKEIEVPASDIYDFDLFLYEFGKGTIMGLNDEFISSPRLDDLAMVHAGTTALTRTAAANSTNVLACFDNEEVGSATKQGADS